MNCTCGAHTIVKDSRTQDRGQWRRRKCTACGAMFSTIEQVCETVSNKRGRPFSNIEPVPRPKRERSPKPAPVKAKVPAHDTAVSKPSARNVIEDMQLQKLLDKM